MSDTQWFDLPTDTPTQTLPEAETAISTAGVEWQEIPEEYTPGEQIQAIIDRSPKPEQARTVLRQAVALHEAVGLPLDDAFHKASIRGTPEWKKGLKEIETGWQSGWVDLDLGYVMYERMAATLSLGSKNPAKRAAAEARVRELDEIAEKIEKGRPPQVDPKKQGLLWRALTSAGRILPIMLKGIEKGGQLGLATGTGAAATTAILGQAGPQVGMPEEIVTVPGAFATGFGIGTTVGATQHIMKVEAGLSMVEMLKEGIDPQVAAAASLGVGVINGLLEVVQINDLLNTIPGVNVIVQQAIRKSTAALVKRGVFRALARTGISMVKHTGIETLQEVAQESVAIAAEELGKQLTNDMNRAAHLARRDSPLKQLTPATIGEIVERLKQTAIDSGLGFGVLQLPGAVGSMVSTTGRVEAATTKVAPTPIETIRMDVAKAIEVETPNVETARATLDVAETAKAAEIAQAEVLTPQMVREAVELADMQEAVEERAQIPETIASIAEIIPTTPEETRAAVESGKWVDDITLSHFHEESWTKSEIARREDLRGLASYLADTGLATSFDAFVAAAKEIEVTPQSTEYYQGIWDTTPKAEVELDEAQEVSVDARIDATIAAEEKQTARIPVTDRLLGELEKTPMWRPDLEKVSDVLAVKELPVTVVEGEELNAAQIANELGHNKKRLVQRMTHDFLKPPSAGIGSVAINQIRALQESYTVKETKSLDKARKALTSWQTAHPGQALIPEAKAIMNRKGIKDISVGELIDLYQQSRDIRKQGAITEKARRERIKARRVQMATDMLAEIPGGMVAKRLGEFASAETQKQEKVFARKGKIKSNILHPLRLFQSLGPAFQKTFWDNRKAWEGREIIRQKGWDRGIRDLFEKTGTTAKEMLRKVPGTNYYIDDLMTYYGQMQDPNGRKAILFGNDEDETKISRLVAELPQKYRDFVDGVIELNSKGYPEVEKIQIETNGIAAPKVDRYLPLRRQEDFGKPFSQELSTQAAIRESARIAGLQKGFTNQRVTFKEGTQQARFRTDFMNILVEQVAKESKFVEGEEWARDMGWLLSGKSKESKQFLEAVKQKHGQPVVTFLKDYVNAVIQPESFNGKDFHGLISRVFRNFSDAALMYKLSTIFIQLEGPFRYLSQLDAKQWPYLFAGLWKATTQPGKTLAAMYERSPVMQAMADSGAIDPALHEGRGLRHARSEIGLNLQMARKEMREAGYAGLKAMNAWTIASGWTAVYQANLAKTGNIETAVKMADEATFLTQPSGELADAPRMYWTSKKNIILAFLQRFSRANNQMAQMMTVDLWKDLKTGHPAKALGVVLSFAIGAYLNSLRRRKRPPKDVQEYLEDGIAGITDNLGAITFGAAPAFVAGATSGFKPGGINPLEPVYRAGAIGKDILYGNVSGKEVWRLINTVMQATGLPSPAAENVVRTMYDFENMGFRFDPIELFGRRPRGE